MKDEHKTKIYEPSEEFIQKYKDFFVGVLEKSFGHNDVGKDGEAFFSIYSFDEKNKKKTKKGSEELFVNNYDFFKKETDGFEFINLPLNNHSDFIRFGGNPWLKVEDSDGSFRVVKNENKHADAQSIIMPLKLFEYYFHGLSIENIENEIDFSFLANENTFYFGQKKKNTWSNQAFFHNDLALASLFLKKGVCFFRTEDQKQNSFLDKLLDVSVNLPFMSKNQKQIDEIKELIWSQIDKKEFLKDPFLEHERLLHKIIEDRHSFYSFKTFSLDFFSFFKKTFFQCEDDNKTVNDLIEESLISGNKENLMLLSDWVSVNSRLFNYLFFKNDNEDLFEDDFRKKIIGDFGNFIEEGFKAFSLNNYIGKNEKNNTEKVKDNWSFFINYFIEKEKEITLKSPDLDMFSSYSKNFENHFFLLSEKTDLEKAEEKYISRLFSGFDKSLSQVHEYFTAFLVVQFFLGGKFEHPISRYQDTILSSKKLQNFKCLFKEIESSLEGVVFLKKVGFYEKAEALFDNMSMFNPVKKLCHEEKTFFHLKMFLESLKKDRENLLAFYKKDYNYKMVFESKSSALVSNDSNKTTRKDNLKFPDFYKRNELSRDFLNKNKESSVILSKSFCAMEEKGKFISQMLTGLMNFELEEGNRFLSNSQQTTKEDAKKHLFKYAFHLNKKSLFNFKKESAYHLISVGELYLKTTSWIIFSRDKVINELTKKNNSSASRKNNKLKVHDDKILNSINYIVSDMFNYTAFMMNGENFNRTSDDFLYSFMPDILKSVTKEKVFFSRISEDFKDIKLLNQGKDILENLESAILLASFHNYNKFITLKKKSGCSEDDLFKENEKLFNQIKSIKGINFNKFISKLNVYDLDKLKKDFFLTELDDKFFSSTQKMDGFFKFIEKETLKNMSMPKDNRATIDKKNTSRF